MRKDKRVRTVAQIDSMVFLLKDVLFTILVPAYIAARDGADEDDSSLNREILLAVGRIIASAKLYGQPECERILMNGCKSGYPFVYFHELLSELKRNGA